MIHLFAGRLFDDFNMIVCMGQAMIVTKSFGKKPAFHSSIWQELRSHAESLAGQSADLGLLGTKAATDDLVQWLDKAIASQTANSAPAPEEITGRIQNHLREVVTLLRRESQTPRFLMIASEHVRFYEQPGPLFGPAVDAAFPGIRYDLAEAAKCIALERGTAAVFHLVRCLEAGIRAIARCLSIPDPTTGYGRNWGQILKDVKIAMDARWPNAANRMSGDGQTFESLHASLAALKTPYRDSTMHLEEKYTDEEARYVFEMVRGLR